MLRHTLSLCALSLILVWGGCFGTAEQPTAPSQDAVIPAVEEGYNCQSPWSRQLLTVTAVAEDGSYVRWSPDAWLRFSWVVRTSGFIVRVTNSSRRPVEDVRLLVAVPARLPEDGWSVTLGNPATVYSSLADFPHKSLLNSPYPYVPHWIYRPAGNARFLILEGPEVLEPGKSWDVPCQLYRGMVDGFRVHFDAAGVHAWSPPAFDLTAIPPRQVDLAPGGRDQASVRK